jgi:hypothetical protein
MDYFRVPSIRHYLLVVTDNQAVTHHARREDGQIATKLFGSGEVVLGPPGLTIEVGCPLRR